MIFLLVKANVKWLAYIHVDTSGKWLWKFFPIVVFSIFWKIDKQWRTLALIRCTWNILFKNCICARPHFHFWRVSANFSQSVPQLSLQKMTFVFYEILQTWNNSTHLFWAIWSMQKIKLIVFEFFKACEKLNSCFLSFLSLQKIKAMLLELF